MDDVVDALDEQGLQVEQCINEYGPAQQEISIRYADALRAADNQVAFKDTVRGVVEVEHGLRASFAPKPFPDGIGSGAHLHFSLWDTDGRTNLLGDPAAGPHALSRLGRSFVAGVLEHLPALVALTCPSAQSYARLQPSSWASATTAWGYDNREAALRVASPFWGEEKASLNLELKPVDGSANPYLALGGLIVAGLDGVARELELPPPAEKDPAAMDAAERERHGVRDLPTDQLAANALLEADAVLTDVLGPLLTRSLLALRRAEHATAVERGEDWVRDALFGVF
jgi:glutamine synthetase